MDNPFQFASILSFCTGLRGLERGIERSFGPVRTRAIVEIEAFIIENLLAGMEAGMVAPAPIWANLKTFDPEPFRGKIHGITGGYPCPPFSTAGQRKGTADPRHLYPFISHSMRTIRPVWGFFENVSGHLSLGYDEVYRDLSEMGYNVEAGIFSASEVGAGHQRKRLFILAILADAFSETERTRLRDLYFPDARPPGPEESSEEQSWQFINADKILADPDGAERWQILAERFGYTTGTVGLQPGGEEITGRSEQCGPPVGNAPGDDQRGKGQRGSNGQKPVGRSGPAKILAIPAIPGLEGRQEQYGRYQQSAAERSGDQWPARPGEPQYTWEASRISEPGLGRSINGYDFTEDLLRALGNSVVEQQSAKAILHLLFKHLFR